MPAPTTRNSPPQSLSGMDGQSVVIKERFLPLNGMGPSSMMFPWKRRTLLGKRHRQRLIRVAQAGCVSHEVLEQIHQLVGKIDAIKEGARQSVALPCRFVPPQLRQV